MPSPLETLEAMRVSMDLWLISTAKSLGLKTSYFTLIVILVLLLVVFTPLYFYRRRVKRQGLLVKGEGEEEKELSPIESLEELLGELKDRYSLQSLTLATGDGLLISSTAANPEEEAARGAMLSEGILSQGYTLAVLHGNGTEFIFPMEYRGSLILVSGKSPGEVDRALARGIGEEIELILPRVY